MPEGLTGLEPLKILISVAPGAVFANFRSFALRGFFPKLSKDDLGALAISSSVYALLVHLTGTDLTSTGILDRRSGIYWILILFIVPTLFGFMSGLGEANDFVGRSLRSLGFRFPSPEPNAWETVFRELPNGSLLMVRLDDLWVYGRWLHGSCSSQLTDSRDLFLSEVGDLSENGIYTPYLPQRGVYLGAGEIKRIEIIQNPNAEKDEQDE